MFCNNIILGLRPWRNWYTRSTKDAVEKSLGVRFPLVAPSGFTYAATANVM